MQAVSHFLVGVIIQLLIGDLVAPVGLFLVILLSFFSHFLIDSLAKMTYHLKDPHPEDKFWLSYHIIIFASSFFVLVYFWNPFWLAMGCSVLIDIYDWVFIRGMRVLKKDPGWFSKYELHPYIDRFRAKYFAWLPDWNEKRYGVVPEAILITILVVVINYL
ncbi:MAG: hypothetical protein ACTSRS_12960 [Candidatus Helarchaeota archaeon]